MKSKNNSPKPDESVMALHDVLNDGDSERIAEAVRVAELDTSSEIVVKLSAATSNETMLAIAQAEFERLGLAGLPQHNGVLIYVSLNRRSVEILVGEKAAEVMPRDPWHEAAEIVATGFKRNTPAHGIIAAIELIAPYLAKNFPSTGAPQVDLPNVSEDS